MPSELPEVSVLGDRLYLVCLLIEVILLRFLFFLCNAYRGDVNGAGGQEVLAPLVSEQVVVPLAVSVIVLDGYALQLLLRRVCGEDLAGCLFFSEFLERRETHVTAYNDEAVRLRQRVYQKLAQVQHLWVVLDGLLEFVELVVSD